MMDDISLADIKSMIESEDWKCREFSERKAYICAKLTALIYRYTAGYEMKGIKRKNIIPSSAYQEILKKGKPNNIKKLLESAGLGESFIIERKYAVILGIKTQEVVFIAVRGTKHLYNRLINQSVKKTGRFYVGKDISYHRGFYNAVLDMMRELYTNIQHETEKGISFCITGHSLGGALAAILNSIWWYISDSYHPNPFVFGFLKNYKHADNLSQCYTFGMPKYGDQGAVQFLPAPYHIYNENDIVPGVLPAFAGFKNCTSEYLINGSGIIIPHERKTDSLFNWLRVLTFGYGNQYHKIEYYLELIDRAKDRNGD